MPLVITHVFVSAKSDGADPTLVQPSNWNAGHIVGGGTLGDLVVYDTGAASHVNSVADVALGSVLASGGVGAVPGYTKRPPLEALIFPLTTPATPVDGTAWVEAIGTSPARVMALKVRDGGVVKTLASITY